MLHEQNATKFEVKHQTNQGQDYVTGAQQAIT